MNARRCVLIMRAVGLSTIAAATLAGALRASADCAEWGWKPGQCLPGTNAEVYATAAWDPDGLAGSAPELLVAGGAFEAAGGAPAYHVAQWNGSVWRPLGWGMDGTVSALTVYNGELIAGGEFTLAGGEWCKRIARWDGSAWQPLGSGMNGSVNALTVYNGELIAGGSSPSPAARRATASRAGTAASGGH